MHGTIEHAASRTHRVIRRHSDWTLKEHEVVVSFWPDVGEIKSRLPHRTRRAIQQFAGKCNLREPRQMWTAADDGKLKRLAAEGQRTPQIAEALGKTAGQVARRLSYTRTRIAPRPPAHSHDPLVNSIRQRAFDMKMTLADLDRSLGKLKVFQQASGKQHVHHRHIQRAVKALGGQLVVKWPDE